MFRSAFVFLLTGDVSYANPVRTELLNQIAQSGTNWGDDMVTFHLGLLVMIGFLLASPVSAAILYVNNTASCPGTGSTGTPYCSIQRAFDVVNAGDTIRIRHGGIAYDERAILTRSGSNGNPIIIEPDTGHTPTIRYAGNGSQSAALELRKVSYVTVQNLLFDAAGVYPSQYALWVHATLSAGDGATMVGIQILGNTFRNWGGTQAQATTSEMGTVAIDGGFCNPCPGVVNGAVVRGNTFDNNRTINLMIMHGNNTLVEQNTFTNTKCGRRSGDAADTLGIFVLDGASSGSSGTIIRQNTFRDWQPKNQCGIASSAYDTLAAIWCDVGPDNGIVEDNIIDNINGGDSTEVGYASQGVFIEFNCSGWITQRNVISNVGVTGLRQRIGNTTDPANQWLNNTIYNTGQNGIQVATGKAVIKNNIFHNAGTVNLHFDSSSSGLHTINYNLYYDNSGGNKVGRWGGGVLNMSQWKSACNCDANSLNTNPQFVSTTVGSEDLHLQGTSPARGSGEGGVDMGAYATTSVAITSPTTGATLTTGQPVITISGTASGTVSLTWECLTCTPINGVLNPSGNWSTGPITLNTGVNTFTVTGLDAQSEPVQDTLAITLTTPDILSNRIAQYHFDEGAGAIAFDASGNGRNATLQGGFTWQAGLSGPFSIQFDGISGQGFVSGLLGSPANVSIATKVQVLNGDTGEVVSIGDYAAIRINATGMQGFVRVSGAWANLIYNQPIAVGWHNIVYTAGSGSHELYLDGQLVASASVGAIVYSGLGSNTFIGQHGNGQDYRLNARIDETIIYSRKLSLVDVQALITYAPSPPQISINFPTTATTYNTMTGSVTISGTATDNTTVAAVTGSCATCTPANFTASGTTNWSVTNLTLSQGSNTITMRATDNEGEFTQTQLIVVYTPQVAGADRYVSTSGNDNNDGSIGSPWRTIQKAANTATSGMTVSVGPGVYQEHVVMQNSGGSSTQKITFKGTRDAGGNWLTTVNGSVAVGGWVAAPEMCSGVWKASLGSPQALYSNGKAIWRIGDPQMQGQAPGSEGNGQQNLCRASNATVTFFGSTVPFWDGIEALYGNLNGQTYVRFRNGENPSSKGMTAANGLYTFDLNGRSNISIEDFYITGSRDQIRLPVGSSNVTVKNNYITGGRRRVWLNGANGSVIENNKITLDGIGFVAFPGGAWSGHGDTNAVHRNQYGVNKFVIGFTDTDDCSIMVAGGSSNSVIRGNEIYSAMLGTQISESTSNTQYINNYWHHFSDIAFYVYPDNASIYISENHIIDSSHVLRFNNVHRAVDLYAWANRSWQPGSSAKHWHISPDSAQSNTANIWFYHNTCTGGGWCIDVGGESSQTLPNMHVRNNIISVHGLTSGPSPNGWDVQNNPSTSLWLGVSSPPTYWLPLGNSLRNSAPSLVSLGLPGMNSTYYVDGQPDYGARQGLESEPPPPPSPIATSLGFVLQPVNATNEEEQSVSVQVIDQFGQPMLVNGTTVTLAIGENPGSGILTGDTQVVTVAGVATFDNIAIDNGGVGYTLIASSTGLVSATSNTFDITEVPVATTLDFLQQPTDEVTNGVITPHIQVRVLDQLGGVVIGATNSITITISSSHNPGSATLIGTGSRNAVDGIATFNDLIVNMQGLGYRLVASAVGFADILSDPFNIAAPISPIQPGPVLTRRSSTLSLVRIRR